ncbi:MAG: hypothetical protein AB7O96_09090 [Pseudobdellovibrionaceae bacterium]
MNQESASAIELQKPGAGLPLPQRVMLKFWLGPFVSKRATWMDNRKMYEAVTQKIIDRVERVAAEKRDKKILVPPQRGLEDSSRFWSINETLEHLLMVIGGTEYIILQLSSGSPPDLKVDIAKLKPKGSEEDLFSTFKKRAPVVMRDLDENLKQKGMNRDSNSKHHHPWFGSITAKQWYWLLAMHQAIHANQVKKITESLG